MLRQRDWQRGVGLGFLMLLGAVQSTSPSRGSRLVSGADGWSLEPVVWVSASPCPFMASRHPLSPAPGLRASTAPCSQRKSYLLGRGRGYSPIR